MTITIEMTHRSQAAAVAAAEYDALLRMLRGLDEGAWDAVTACAPWTVRDMVAHVAGAAEESVRMRVQARHMLRAKTRDRAIPVVESLGAQQIADRAGRGPAQLLAELERLASHAPARRAKVPGVVRRLGLPDPQALPGDTMGYLLDVVYARDVWMHRIDIARATGCDLLDSGVEDRVVTQVVRDLQRAWSGTPFTLELTGRVSGAWPVAGGGAGVSVDAVALCRLFSGRSDETEPAYDGDDPRLVDRLREIRILF